MLPDSVITSGFPPLTEGVLVLPPLPLYNEPELGYYAVLESPELERTGKHQMHNICVLTQHTESSNSFTRLATSCSPEVHHAHSGVSAVEI